MTEHPAQDVPRQSPQPRQLAESAQSPASDAPDLLVIGHATRDLLSGGAWRLGGSVTYAAVTAARLGLRPAVVTSGTPRLQDALRQALPDHVPLCVVPSSTDTTFENLYLGGSRRQYLRGTAQPLTLACVPDAWRRAPLVLLAPLAQEIAPEVASALRRAAPTALLAATPQGWLRRWNATGAVSPGPFAAASEILPALTALVLSREDLLPPPGGSGMPGMAEAAADAQIAAWAQHVPMVVVTQGARGALLYLNGSAPEAFSGYPIREVDPTGAGDVFATAFLMRLRETGDPRAAVDFANRVAALSVEGEGVCAIPSRESLLARFPELAGQP